MEPRPLVLTEDRWAGRLSIADFPDPVSALGTMKLPKRVDHKIPRVRRDLANVDTLERHGIGVVVANTRKLRSISAAKANTDRLDARTLGAGVDGGTDG